jgi:hypothetical protein
MSPLLPDTEDSAPVALGARAGELASDAGIPAAADLRRYLTGPHADHHLELGHAAGGRTTGIFFTASRNLSYELRAGRRLAGEPSGSSRPSILARACLAGKKRDCMATARKDVGSRCVTECTAQDKQQLCQVKREICVEQTAGIGGTLGQQCESMMQACLVEAKQDDASVSACRNSCESRLAGERCAG